MFTSELKQAVENTCDIDVALENMGYIEPGHGAKGKQRWLMRDADVSKMNRVHQGKKFIYGATLLVQAKMDSLPAMTAQGNVAILPAMIPVPISHPQSHLDTQTTWIKWPKSNP